MESRLLPSDSWFYILNKNKMNYPLRLDGLYKDSDTLIDKLEEKQNEIGDELPLFQKFPNLADDYRDLKQIILEWAEDLEVTHSPYDSKSGEHWQNLMDFLAVFRAHFESWLGEELPEWAYYKPQTNEKAMDFFQQLFDMIDQEYDEDWKNQFDNMTRYTIQEWKDIFENWKETVATEDWDKYMEKVREMTRFIHQIKWSLRMCGMSEFEIKVLMENNDTTEEG